MRRPGIILNHACKLAALDRPASGRSGEHSRSGQNSKLKFWRCGISCGYCNGRYAERDVMGTTRTRGVLSISPALPSSRNGWARHTQLMRSSSKHVAMQPRRAGSGRKRPERRFGARYRLIRPGQSMFGRYKIGRGYHADNGPIKRSRSRWRMISWAASAGVMSVVSMTSSESCGSS